MASDCHGQTEGGEILDREQWINGAYKIFLGAFPDLRLDLIGTVAEGDEVMVRWRARGTHTGDALGVPPTGLKTDFRGMSWFRFRDGQIVQGLDSWNQSGLMQALMTGATDGSCKVA